MNQLGPFVVLIAVATVLLAGFGWLVAWWNEETRRIRRGLRHVLGEEPHALIMAPGRGRGAGFNFTTGAMAVAWDVGAWCLVYRIDELIGVELVIDGQVAARSWRGEARRPLDVVGGAERQVTLRLVFDDARYPDFTLELWSALAELRKHRGGSADEAIAEGNRWIARTESVFRRTATPARASVAPKPEPPPALWPKDEEEEPPAAEPAEDEEPEPLAVAATAAALELADDGAPKPQELPFAPKNEPLEEDDEGPIV